LAKTDGGRGLRGGKSTLIYIVFGMHKSGTTLVAEMLHRAGIHMVEDEDGNPDYQTGNKYERPVASSLNQDILNCRNVGSVDITKPRKLELTEAQRQRMQEIISKYGANGRDWGFKDPRTCLTYPLWKPHLPEHRLVVTYRSPFEVALHYVAGTRPFAPIIPWRLGKALRAYALNNQCITTILEKTDSDYIVLRYERLMSSVQELERFSRFIDKPLVDARQVNLYRSRTEDAPLLRAIAILIVTFLCCRPYILFKRLEKIRLQQVLLGL
jgi:hypothetical protein